MKIKNLLMVLLFVLILMSFVFSPSLFAQQKEKEEKAQEEKLVIIPPLVKAVLQEGIITRQTRQDIPFSIIRHFYLPAKEYLYNTFIFTVKNADLGYSPLVLPAQTAGEEEAKEEKEQQPPPEPVSPPTILLAKFHVFLQFNRIENNAPGKLVREVYIPVGIQVEDSEYEPEEEGFYSTGYSLLPGDYLLSMAIASADLGRIGTQYFEFSLPNAASFTDSLETTPIFFIRGIREMPGPETKLRVHKGFFTYSYLQINPNLESVYSVGENLDIFYYIFGAKTDEEGKCNITINYEVLKGEETAIRFSPQTYQIPVVSQPLPLKKTVLVKSETEGEKKERRDIEPGRYTLLIKIKDQISGISLDKQIEFEVK